MYFFPFEYYRLVHEFQLKNSYAPNLSKIWWGRFVYLAPPLIYSSRVLIEFVVHATRINFFVHRKYNYRQV